MQQQAFKHGNYLLKRECYTVVVSWIGDKSIEVLERTDYPRIGEAVSAFKETKLKIKIGSYTAGVRKFLIASRSFRSSDQMKKLIADKFFTPAEIRDGLKRWIHINFIEFI